MIVDIRMRDQRRRLITSAVCVLIGLAVMAVASTDARAQSLSPTRFVPLAGANVVNIVAHEYAFDVPASIPAGLTTFRFVDAGKELHHVKLVRLTDGRTLADVFAVLKGGGNLPAWMQRVGGPKAPVANGGVTYGTLVLEPGSYVAYCEANAPDGQPHFMKGMMKSFIVTPSSRHAALPKGDVRITLSDYKFTFSHPLTHGRHVIAVHNGASQAHEIFIQRFAPGKTPADLAVWKANHVGSSPLSSFGGTTDLPPGGTQIIQSDFPPGFYELTCFVPDAKDGKPHYQHGMIETIEVK